MDIVDKVLVPVYTYNNNNYYYYYYYYEPDFDVTLLA